MAKGFKNAKTGKVFKIVGMKKVPDKDGVEQVHLTMQGEFATFTEVLDKERFKKLGYEPCEIEEEETVG